MKPILFDKDATTFTTNGKGRLDCIECKVVEERNGQYELSMTITEDVLHASEIEMSSIIVVKPSQNGSNQAFRVYKITKADNGRFDISAQHISYQLSYIPAMPFAVVASQSACAETLQGLKDNSAEDNPFTFWTDVTTIAPYNQTIPASIRQRLGGIEGSVIDQFGGEYEWDNYNVKLWRNRGLSTPNVTLRYGKNITDISQEKYISNTITGICPYWTDTDGKQTVVLPEKVVESEYADNYPFKRTITVDMSQEFETAPTVEQLRARAEDYLDKEGIGIPTVSIKVSFINLADTEEYKDIAPLQNVSLCDRIAVQFDKLGINATAKVVKTTYDVLAERYDSIEVGTVKTSLAQTITDTNGAIETTFEKAMYATKNATAWLTGSNGYVMAVKNVDGTWKELLFMDTNDAETAHNVIRINENGIGFSRNGVAGPYTQAWTMDGKLVIGGTNVPSLSVMYNNIEVAKIDKTGILWNNPDTKNATFKFQGDQLRMYAWDTDDNRTVGALVTMKTVINGVNERVLSLLGYCDNDNESNQTGIGFYLKINNINHTVFEYDHSDYDRGDTPYIINTVNGTLFPNNPGGGITIKNGFVKNWHLYGITLSEIKAGIHSLKFTDGLVTGYDYVDHVFSGSFRAGSQGNLNVTVDHGLITGVSQV